MRLVLDTVQTIVSRPKGSWRYQDAFAVSTYQLQWSPRMGRFVWKMVDRTGKMSWKKAVRSGKGRMVGSPRKWSSIERETLESHPMSPYNQD